MASNRNGPRLRWVMKLPVAALGSSDAPAILLKPFDDVANFHSGHCPLTTAFFQLLLPSQHACFVPFRFGFGDHALFLIQNGKAGVGEDVVGIEFGDAVGDFDGFVEAVQVLEGAAHAVEGVGEGGVGGQGFAVFGHGLLVVSFGDQIERGVVVVFGLSGIGAVAGRVVGHRAKSWVESSMRRLDDGAAPTGLASRSRFPRGLRPGLLYTAASRLGLAQRTRLCRSWANPDRPLRLRSGQALRIVRENSVVPPGLQSLPPPLPALNRWAKLVRPSGAGVLVEQYEVPVRRARCSKSLLL